MLELRPNCEYCDCDLAPNSDEAMICSYECTFCRTCVESVLENVCPNCGGGFTKRPVRPTKDRRAGVSLQHQPPSATRVNKKFNEQDIATFIKDIKEIPPEER